MCLYGRYCAFYEAVRPGLSRLWQVCGPSDVSYRRSIAMDVIYLRKASPRLDLLVILRIIKVLMTLRGAC
ncbi:hypothetical protein GCM10011415_06830 [Salipiger pallidus]|uniref:Bacterial sugar transferase domain-containing protein n=1 Tax=Salipiger pallidus TaxID=1775170 RepID=A0A8J2ZHA6_9RHOB|nr:sugar transferase [Salipiger pallidus]GGG63055.1 hypothetical protein GCM10011415_06830 [Salipiger pallidus]